MGTKQSFAGDLRASILQAAIQGRLTSREAGDGDARTLLGEIRKGKARLIKEKKIKKQKPLPPITDGEIPFDIPDNWCWVRLGHLILQDIGGGTPSKSNPTYWNGTIPWMSVKDFSANPNGICDTLEHITQKAVSMSTTNVIPAGNIIVCTRVGLGKIAVNHVDLAINQDLRALIFPKNIEKDYFMYYYKAQNVTGTGTTVKGITREFLMNMLVPLPPLSEQKRIVEKVDRLMKEAEGLEEAEQALTALREGFPSDLRASILQAAIQGRLTFRKAGDGDARALLGEIGKGKARLIKEKKIKKQKPLPPITDGEIPFDIPDNWCWVRLGHLILQDIGGGTPSKSNPTYWNGTIPWMSVKDFSANPNGICDTLEHITQKAVSMSTTNVIPAGNIIVCTRVGLGKIAVNHVDLAINQDLRALIFPKNIEKDYFMYYYKAQNVTGTGTTVKGITREFLMNMLVPLPPLSEQKRIVEKVDLLMKEVDSLLAAGT